MDILGQSYNYTLVNGTTGLCTDGKGYDDIDIKTRCLPDTANPSYQWGFSTMLTGVFLIIQLVWAITMYIVWQDAQHNSTLVKSGYRMNMLRAAFAASVAAKQKTGMGGRDLVRTDTKSLQKDLYGTKKKRMAEVESDVFVGGKESRFDSSDEEMELRRRNSGNRHDDT
jgi:succinate dehydrogenase hydrophobic anchor subunit